MIYIRKHVSMSLEGVAILWLVQLHGHDEEDGACVVGDWFADTWPEALNLAGQIVAQRADRFAQCTAVEWRYLSSENTPAGWWLAWRCHTCTEAWSELRHTPNPSAHLQWHRKALGPGRNSEYKTRIDRLKDILRAERAGVGRWADLDEL